MHCHIIINAYVDVYMDDDMYTYITSSVHLLTGQNQRWVSFQPIFIPISANFQPNFRHLHASPSPIFSVLFSPLLYYIQQIDTTHIRNPFSHLQQTHFHTYKIPQPTFTHNNRCFRVLHSIGTLGHFG